MPTLYLLFGRFLRGCADSLPLGLALAGMPPAGAAGDAATAGYGIDRLMWMALLCRSVLPLARSSSPPVDSAGSWWSTSASVDVLHDATMRPALSCTSSAASSTAGARAAPRPCTWTDSQRPLSSSFFTFARWAACERRRVTSTWLGPRRELTLTDGARRRASDDMPTKSLPSKWWDHAQYLYL